MVRSKWCATHLPVAAHGLHVGLVELLLVHLVRLRVGVRIRVKVRVSLDVGGDG